MKILKYLVISLSLFQFVTAKEYENDGFNKSENKLTLQSEGVERGPLFFRIRVTEDNMGGWEKFAINAVKALQDKGYPEKDIRELRYATEQFCRYLTPNNTWVIGASTTPYSQAMAPESIEMVMVATIDYPSDSIQHMGIFPNPNFNEQKHSNLVFSLYHFSVTMLSKERSGLMTVITHPLYSMSQILKMFFPQSEVSIDSTVTVKIPIQSILQT